MAYVTPPVVTFPEHTVTTPEILADMHRSNPGHPMLERIPALAKTLGVEQRQFVSPLDVVARTGTVDERNTVAAEAMLALAEQAARDALDRSGLTAGDIDWIITSHTTTPLTPGLDVHLINKIDFKPTIKRIPVTQLGCVGGAHALTLANDLVDATPGTRVLIVVGEALSTVYQRSDTTTAGFLYRLLFGDSAAACIVSSDPEGACLNMQAAWQYTVPGTMKHYALHTRAEGMFFTSHSNSSGGAAHVMGPLAQWLRDYDPDWAPEVVIAHAGGPKPLELMAKGLGCPPGLLSHSWDSLRLRGNLGGASVLDVLARTHEDAPRNGSPTLLLGIGPGLTGAAIRGESISDNSTE
ncbi:PhlD (plasmid) [Streptomyces sp. HU2014]|uniref:PhlD n=1 Tax=Streptomyces sp. HU2014 TaxID=2939414 RepID=UPI00200DFD82|nr:PhlD [Streptomyces sp. HU2014]UQI49708.1 PhlD [Streptomyces sp. HU2014]